MRMSVEWGREWGGGDVKKVFRAVIAPGRVVADGGVIVPGAKIS